MKGFVHAMLHEIIIKKNDAGQRLDKFVLKFMPSLPKNMLYKLIRQKDISQHRSLNKFRLSEVFPLYRKADLSQVILL